MISFAISKTLILGFRLLQYLSGEIFVASQASIVFWNFYSVLSWKNEPGCSGNAGTKRNVLLKTQSKSDKLTYIETLILSGTTNLITLLHNYYISVGICIFIAFIC